MQDVVDVEGLTAAWLAEVLASEVRSVAIEPVGTGQTAATYRLSLEAPDLAPTLIAKVAAGDDAGRTRVSFAYRNEVGFYAQVAPTVDVAVPRCHHAAIGDDAMQFTLLLDDLRPRTPGVQVDGCAPERVAGAIGNLVGLHAPRWSDPTLTDLDFIEGPTAATAAFTGEVAKAATEGFVERYAPDLDEADVGTLRASAAAVVDWLLTGLEPFSVLHGDYRLDNLMFGVDPHDVVAVDWQTVAVGPPARDVAYLLATGLTVEDRREHEEALVAGYHRALLERGIEGYDAARCFEDYRLGLLHGPLITTVGCMFSPAARTDAADAMFVSMARRTCAAVRDHGSLDLFGRR